VIYVERPAAGEAEAALVLVHGRGAGEHDLVGLFDALDPERRLHGYSPRGPLSLPPGGAHWYAVHRVGFPDPDTFAEGFAALAGFVDSLPYERLVIGGFSQGAVMSFAIGLGRGRPRPLAVIGFSGFVPVVEGWELGDAPFHFGSRRTRTTVISLDPHSSRRERNAHIASPEPPPHAAAEIGSRASFR